MRVVYIGYYIGFLYGEEERIVLERFFIVVKGEVDRFFFR